MEKHEASSSFSKCEVLDVFPMLNEDDWDESPFLTRRYISIWDHWLFEKGNQSLLNNASSDDEQAWQTKFRKLHELIPESTAAYVCEYADGGWNISQEVSKESYMERLDEFCMMLLLPKLQIIYQTSTDFTSLVYYQQEKSMEVFGKWVKDSGLEYIGVSP